MKQIAAIILTFLILVSNAGVSVNIHFCGNHLVRSQIALGDPGLDCGMERKGGNCENRTRSEGSLEKTDCCKNIHSVYQIKDDTKISTTNFSFDNDKVFINPELFRNRQYLSYTISDTKISGLLPPLIPKLIYLFFQSFLN